MKDSNRKDFGVLYSIEDKDAGKWIAYQIKSMGYTVSAQSLELISDNTLLGKVETASKYLKAIVVLISDASITSIIQDEEVRNRFVFGATGYESVLYIIKIKGCKTDNNIFAHFPFIEIPVNINEDKASELLITLLSGTGRSSARKPYFQSITRRKRQDNVPLVEGISFLEVLSCRIKEYEYTIHQIVQGNYHMKLALEVEQKRVVEEKDEENGEKVKKEIIVWEEVDTESILLDKNNYIIINPSGTGKTTFLQYLGRELLNKFDKYHYIPLNRSCLDINNRGVMDIYDYIVKEVSNIYGYGIVHDNLDNLCLLLDGLDQSYSIDEIAALLDTERVDYPLHNAKIIITSRENTANKAPKEYNKLRLKLPDNKEIQNYFKEDYSSIKPLLDYSRDLIASPILLEMLKTLSQKGELRGIITNRTEIYSRFVSLLLCKEKEKPRYFQQSQQVKDFLNFEIDAALNNIAFHTLNENQILKIEKASLYACGISEDNIMALLNTGLFSEFIEDNKQSLVFRHQSFQAYFAARFIHLHPDLFRKIALDIRYFIDDTWAEVICFYINLELNVEKLKRIIDLLIFPKRNIGNMEKILRLIYTTIFLSETTIFPERTIRLLINLAQITNLEYIFDYYINLLNRINYSNEVYRENFTNIIIIPALKVNNFSIREKAIEAFGKIGTVKQIDYLIPFLKDNSIYIRMTAVVAFKKIGTRDQIQHLIPLFNDSISYVREAAIEAFGEVATCDQIDYILPLLDDSNVSVRAAAAKAFVHIKTKKQIELLIPLLKDSNPIIRGVAAETYGNIKSGNQLNYLLPLIKDSDGYVRWVTIKAIGKMVSVNHLIPLLMDDDLMVRMVAIEYFGEIASVKEINYLLPLLKDNCPDVRAVAVEAFGKIATVDQINYLIPLFKDENRLVRRLAVETFGNIAIVNNLDYLLPLFNDNIPYIRQAATVAFGIIASVDQIGYLKPLLKDNSEDVRKAAVDAFGKIAMASHVGNLIPLFYKDKDHCPCKAACCYHGICI